MIRVFPRRTKWTPIDELAFIGGVPLVRPSDQPVRISVTFTWDISYSKYLYNQWAQCYSDVKIGGPAFDDHGGEFIPGRFIKEGVTITSRGCFKRCGWCFVPKREGKIREIEIKDGHIIQDNNLLACSRKHIEAVFDMLRKQKKSAEFKGGLDTTLLQDWHIDLLKTIKFKEVWFACDTTGGMRWLKRASNMLKEIPRYKKYCFVMIGLKETPIDAEGRLREVYNLGFRPFSQLYQSEQKRDYSKEWRDLNCAWSRPAAYESIMKPTKNK